MSGSIFVFFCWNQNVQLKFLNQNGRQFRLHYAREYVNILGSRVRTVYGAGLVDKT